MNFGCLKSAVDLRDYRLVVKNTEKFPKSFKVANSQFNIKNQGRVNSCTAYATSTVLEHHSKTKLSTNFIYGIRKKLYNHGGEGMTLRDACKIAYSYGDMEYDDCPGNNEVDKVFLIAEEAFNDTEKLNRAYNHKIDLFVNLFNNTDDIKYFLMTYGPVLASIKWYHTSKLDTDYVLVRDHNDIINKSYHAIVIYGWDGDCWLCQNSWGSKWGNNGLFKLKIGDIAESYGLIGRDNLYWDFNVYKPTRGFKIIEWVLKFANFLIAKLFTKVD